MRARADRAGGVPRRLVRGRDGTRGLGRRRVRHLRREENYAELWARRLDFVRPMGDPALVDDHPNFEGLGFDLVHFELDDGVTGEVAYGHTGNFMAMHGGPYEVFVDRTGLLDGVTFPLLTSHVPRPHHHPRRRRPRRRRRAQLPPREVRAEGRARRRRRRARGRRRARRRPRPPRPLRVPGRQGLQGRPRRERARGATSTARTAPTSSCGSRSGRRSTRTTSSSPTSSRPALASSSHEVAAAGAGTAISRRRRARRRASPRPGCPARTPSSSCG